MNSNIWYYDLNHYDIEFVVWNLRVGERVEDVPKRSYKLRQVREANCKRASVTVRSLC